VDLGPMARLLLRIIVANHILSGGCLRIRQSTGKRHATDRESAAAPRVPSTSSGSSSGTSTPGTLVQRHPPPCAMRRRVR
jgi:hypothetical protein